jgi:hypothetical protein
MFRRNDWGYILNLRPSGFRSTEIGEKSTFELLRARVNYNTSQSAVRSYFRCVIPVSLDKKRVSDEALTL